MVGRLIARPAYNEVWVNVYVTPPFMEGAVPGNEQVDVQWDASPTADTYNVYRSLTPGGPYTLIASGVTGVNYLDTGLDNGTTYYYVVTSVKNGEESAYSDEVSATPVPVPDAPENLVATPFDAHVELAWDVSAGADTYSVYRGTTSGVYTLLTSGLVSPAFDDTTAVNGTPYFYVVTASDISGESPYSNEATATPIAIPAAPANLVAVPFDAEVDLTWDPVAGAVTYSVYRGTTSGIYSLLTSGLASPAFDDLTAVNGTPYFYVVTAVNGSGESPYSNEATATPIAIPAAPANLVATPGDSTVGLDWDDSVGAATYSVYRGTTSGVYSLLVAGLVVSTYADNTAVNGTPYFYVVTATNPSGTSGYSNEATATPASAGPVAGYRAWYKADSLMGYVDGDHITSFPDLSVNALNLAVSATVSRRPVYRPTALNGLPGVDFVAADFTILEDNIANYFGAGGTTIFIVLKALAAPPGYPTTYQHIIDTATNAANSRHYAISYTNAGQAKIDAGNQGATVLSVNITAGENVLLAMRFDGANSLMRLNGDGGRQSTATLPVMLASNAPFRMGAQNDAATTHNATFTLCEMILYNTPLSAPDFAAVESYLTSKYAL